MKKILVSTLIAIMVGATLTGCGNSGNGNNSIQQGQQTSLSAKEIVEKLSLSEQTVKNQLSLGLKTLREKLGIAYFFYILFFVN